MHALDCSMSEVANEIQHISVASIKVREISAIA